MNGNYNSDTISRFPLSLADICGVLGIASIAYSVVKDLTNSVSAAIGTAIVVACFGILGWAIYRASPRRHERYKLNVSHDGNHAIGLFRQTEESILVTHFTKDLPSKEYTAAMISRLEQGVIVTRVVSHEIANDSNVKKWLDEFKKYPRYIEHVLQAPALPIEFTVLDERWVIMYLPIKNDPGLLNAAVTLENEKVAGSFYTIFEGLRQRCLKK